MKPKVHVSLNVASIEKSVGFYQDFLGVPPHKRRAGYANFSVEEPALKLALNEKSATSNSGPLNHLGFQVSTTAEVEQARVRLREKGLLALDEGETDCCYAQQDKVWATDPDGNAWEIYAITDDQMETHEKTLDHNISKSPSDVPQSSCPVQTVRDWTSKVRACC